MPSSSTNEVDEIQELEAERRFYGRALLVCVGIAAFLTTTWVMYGVLLSYLEGKELGWGLWALRWWWLVPTTIAAAAFAAMENRWVSAKKELKRLKQRG